VDAEPRLVYRASKVSRAAAWFVLFATAVVSVASIVAAGGGGTKAVVMCAVFALFAWAALRLEVRATPDGLVVCGGRTTRRFPWADVRGFEVDRRTDRDIFVLLKGKARHRLPIVEVATRRAPAEDVRSDLERYWKAHLH
jgi:hypothetical protein